MLALVAQLPLDPHALQRRWHWLEARHIQTMSDQLRAERLTVQAEKVRLHGMEEAFIGVKVMHELACFAHRLATHREGNRHLLDGMDVERLAGPIVDKANCCFEQRRIARLHAAQAAVVKLEAVAGADAMGL